MSNPGKPSLPTYGLLACDVFRDEIEMLAGPTPPWEAIQFFEMGLHDRPDELRSTLQSAVTQFDQNQKLNAIALAYGLCGNGLSGIRAGRHPLVLPRAHDCISVFLGSPAKHEAILNEDPGIYFYSPGWIRGKRVPGPDRESHLRSVYEQRYADDPEMIDDLVDADRSSFDHHNCAAYVDLTGNKSAARYCERCAEWLGWRFRRLEGDPELLGDLLYGNWHEERFLTVPPGKAVGLSGNSDIFKVIDG